MNLTANVSFGESKEDRERRIEGYKKTFQESLIRKERQRYARFATGQDSISQEDAFIPSVVSVKSTVVRIADVAPKQKEQNVFSKLINKIKRNK